VSAHNVDQVLHRAQLFAGFRRALEQTPDQALRDYELCACETAAIRTRDIDALGRAGRGHRLYRLVVHRLAPAGGGVLSSLNRKPMPALEV